MSNRRYDKRTEDRFSPTTRLQRLARFEAVESPPARTLTENELRMAIAGVKPPRKCQCEKPAILTEEDGERRCIHCARAPR